MSSVCRKRPSSTNEFVAAEAGDPSTVEAAVDLIVVPGEYLRIGSDRSVRDSMQADHTRGKAHTPSTTRPARQGGWLRSKRRLQAVDVQRRGAAARTLSGRCTGAAQVCGCAGVLARVRLARGVGVPARRVLEVTEELTRGHLRVVGAIRSNHEQSEATNQEQS